MVVRHPMHWLGIGICASLCLAFGDATRFRFAVLELGPEAMPRQGALPYLALQLARRTSVEVIPAPLMLKPTGKQIFEHPFLVASGETRFPDPGEETVVRLRRHLRSGGMLLLDDAAPERGEFSMAARELAGRLFPRQELVPLPREHTVYKSFYLLDRAGGRRLEDPDLHAVVLDGRVALLLSGNDLLGAFDRDSLGSWTQSTSPGGELQREQAVRLALNIAYYALCLDYKDDQVHAPFILERRRR